MAGVLYIASVGTANIDHRSFRLNFEVNAFLYDQDTAKKLRYIFEEDINDSTLLALETYGKRSSMVKIKEAISQLISPVL